MWTVLTLGAGIVIGLHLPTLPWAHTFWGKVHDKISNAMTVIK